MHNNLKITSVYVEITLKEVKVAVEAVLVVTNGHSIEKLIQIEWIQKKSI